MLLWQWAEKLSVLPGYNELYDEMLCVVKERSGEMEEGKLLYSRGMHSLRQNDPRDVLRYMGRARIRLLTKETIEGGIRAALVCSDAYREMGLYWAARMEALIAANFAMQNRESIYDYPKLGLLAAKQMGWLELKLGRVAPFIAWYELSRYLVYELRSTQQDISNFEEELEMQESVLGCFFLNLNFDDVKALAKLKDGLDKVNLPMARFALLYSLGDIDTLMKEGPKGWSIDRKELDDFFAKWKDQPASKEIRKNLTGETRSYCELDSTIMGVTYHLKARNTFGIVGFSENLLGVIEAALATAKWENLAFIIDRVEILVDMDLRGNNPPTMQLEQPYDPNGYAFIWRPDIMDWMSGTSSKQLSEYLHKFFLKLLLDITIDPIDDMKHEFESWAKDGVFDRAFGTSPIINALKNVIGVKRYEIDYWSKPTASSEI